MYAMYRIICRKLLVLFRLAIIVSLAVYSLSNANAAMHDADEAEVSISAPMDHGATHIQLQDHHHDDLAANHDDGGSSLVKQECCNDFCAGMAIIASSTSIDGPVITGIHDVIDDRGLTGELPALHRPPNI